MFWPLFGSFLVKVPTIPVQFPSCRCLAAVVTLERTWHQDILVGRGFMGNCSPDAWGQVTLAAASQIAQKSNAEAVKSYLLCQNMNTHPIQYISKQELRLFSRTAEGFLAQCWSLSRAWPRGLGTDVLCTRPKLAVLSVGLRTGSKQECKHALRSTTSCKPAFLKKLTKSHRKEERVGGLPLAVVVENISSEKMFQWRQQVGVVWSTWSSIILDTWFPMFTFCGGPYRVNPAVRGRDLTTFRKRHNYIS